MTTSSQKVYPGYKLALLPAQARDALAAGYVREGGYTLREQLPIHQPNTAENIMRLFHLASANGRDPRDQSPYPCYDHLKVKRPGRGPNNAPGTVVRGRLIRRWYV